MGLTYSFTFSAPANVTAVELQTFLFSVEADAEKLGFYPTLTFGLEFKTPKQREIARCLRIWFPICDEKLKGAARPCREQILDFHPKSGRCRLLPKEAEMLVVVNEKGNQGAGDQRGKFIPDK